MKSVIFVTRDPEMLKQFRAAVDGLMLLISGEAKSAKQAIEAYRQDAADLMIVDLFLGESSGLDLVKTIKKVNERLVIILVTRMKERSIVDRAFRFGASDVLVYPLGKDVLRETIKHRLHYLGSTANHAPKV